MKPDFRAEVNRISCFVSFFFVSQSKAEVGKLDSRNLSCAKLHFVSRTRSMDCRQISVLLLLVGGVRHSALSTQHGPPPESDNRSKCPGLRCPREMMRSGSAGAQECTEACASTIILLVRSPSTMRRQQFEAIRSETPARRSTAVDHFSSRPPKKRRTRSCTVVSFCVHRGTVGLWCCQENVGMIHR